MHLVTTVSLTEGAAEAKQHVSKLNLLGLLKFREHRAPVPPSVAPDWAALLPGSGTRAAPGIEIGERNLQSDEQAHGSCDDQQWTRSSIGEQAAVGWAPVP